MIIQTDAEGKRIVLGLSDVAAKYAGVQLVQGGVRAMQESAQITQAVAVLHRSIKDIKPDKPGPGKKKK